MKMNSSSVYWRFSIGLVVVALVVVAILVTYNSPAGAQTPTDEKTIQQTTVTTPEPEPQAEQEPQILSSTADGLTIVPDDELSPMAKNCLTSLDARLRARGVSVLSVSTRVAAELDAQIVRENTDAADELPVVVVRIPSASMDGPDHLFTIKEIQRQTAAMATAGAPIRIMGIVTVDEGTQQETTVTFGVVSASEAEWKEPARMELDEAEASAKSAAIEACSKAGMDLVAFGFGEDDLGRTIELTATLGTDDSGKPGLLIDALQSAVFGLNTTGGAKIATIIVRANGKAGSPVARGTLDFGMAAGLSFWLAPQHKGREDMKPAILQ